MLTHRKMVSCTGIVRINMISIDDTVIEWLDAVTFRLADLVKTIGIDRDHEARAEITIEIADGLCEVCGNPTTGHKLCNKCGKLVCDACAIIDPTGRYCRTCYDLKKQTEATVQRA